MSAQFLNTEKTSSLIAWLALILLLATQGIFATELILPSLPAIARSLNTHDSMVQLTITTYLLGMAISQLIYGPLSDRFGRRPILFIGLIINLIGCLICVFSPSIASLIFGRWLQGIGVGAPMCLSRSIARDVFKPEQLAKMAAYFSTATTFASVLAPVIGGYIQHWFGWEANFMFLTALGLASLILIAIFLVETNTQKNPHAIQLAVMLKNYKQLLTNSLFMGYLIASGVAISGILVYFTMGPFLLQNIVGLSAVEYSWLAIFTAGAMVLGRIFNIVLLAKWGIQQLIVIGNCCMLLAGLCMMIFGWLHWLNVWVIILPMMLFIIGTGLVFANAMTGAFLPFPHMAGAAGALFGSLQIFGTFISTAIAAGLHQQNQIMLSLLLTLLSVFSLLVFYFAVIRTGNNKTATKHHS